MVYLFNHCDELKYPIGFIERITNYTKNLLLIHQGK